MSFRNRYFSPQSSVFVWLVTFHKRLDFFKLKLKHVQRIWLHCFSQTHVHFNHIFTDKVSLCKWADIFISSAAVELAFIFIVVVVTMVCSCIRACPTIYFLKVPLICPDLCICLSVLFQMPLSVTIKQWQLCVITVILFVLLDLNYVCPPPKMWWFQLFGTEYEI